jgi:hypothetical protein
VLAGGSVHGDGWEVGQNVEGARGSQPRAHLVLGLLVEAAPRRGVGGGGG